MYRLTLLSAEAVDGSTTVDPLVRQFTMSGGPTVKQVSIGPRSVNFSENIILTFDQPIKANIDLNKYINFSGGSSVVSRLSKNKIAIQLQKLPKCKQFKITVSKGLKSKYQVATTSDWSKLSRTKCYTTSVYGSSVNGRPLVAYKFGNSGPLTMFVGAIHGNELSSKNLMQAWINELESNPNKLANRRIVVVPNINPDGILGGTRTNARAVNLNRNFPTDNWVKNIKDTDGVHKGGGGKKPLSEPEAAALASLTSKLKPRLLVSFHAIGSLVVGDPGGFSATYASTYASLTGYRDMTGVGETFDYDITGAYEDWTYKNLGIPSMVVELANYSYVNFERHRSALWRMVY